MSHITPFEKGGRRALSEAGGFKDCAAFLKSPLAPLFQRGEQEAQHFFKNPIQLVTSLSTLPARAQ